MIHTFEVPRVLQWYKTPATYLRTHDVEQKEKKETLQLEMHVSMSSKFDRFFTQEVMASILWTKCG